MGNQIRDGCHGFGTPGGITLISGGRILLDPRELGVISWKTHWPSFEAWQHMVGQWLISLALWLLHEASKASDR